MATAEGVSEDTGVGVSRYGSRWWALAALTLSFLVTGLDTYILNTALPTLSDKLGASTSQLQWITAAYTLAFGAAILPLGKLGDRFGRKKLLLAGLILFGAASVIASQVTTAGELIAMRAVMGIGAATITPLATSILPVIFANDSERRRAVAITTVGTMLGMPIGPLLAGWMLSHFAWGSVFLINGPIAAVSVLGVWLCVPENKDPARPSVDWLGAALSAIGMTALIYGIIEQPNYGWSASVLASLGGAAVILAGFVFWQLRIVSPLADLRLFRSPGFSSGSAIFAMVSFAMTGVLFLITQYLQVVQGDSAQATGVRLLPMIGAMLVSAALIEGLAKRIGAKYVIVVGLVVCCAGLLVLSRLSPASSYGYTALALGVFGVGLGFSLPLSADATLAVLPKHQTGSGTALSRTIQRVAISLGAGIVGSLLNSGFRNRLTDVLMGFPADSRSAAIASVSGAHAVATKLGGAAGQQLTDAANAAYVHGMAVAAVVTVIVLAVGVVVGLVWLPGRKAADSPDGAAPASPAEPGPGDQSPAEGLL